MSTPSKVSGTFPPPFPYIFSLDKNPNFFWEIQNGWLPIVTLYFFHFPEIQKLTSFLCAFLFYRLGCHRQLSSFFVLVPIIMIHCSTKNYSAATSKSCVRLHFLTKKLLCQTFATLLPLGLTLCHYWIRAIKHNFYSFLWNSTIISSNRIGRSFNEKYNKFSNICCFSEANDDQIFVAARNNHVNAAILVVPDQ